jgi:hypothetical protein
VAVDAEGNVYVADQGNNTIRKISSEGVVSTLAGLAGNPGNADGLSSSARFDSPTGIAVDAQGNVYVADQNNSTIRKITSDGAVTTLAGMAKLTGSADGAGMDARFDHPVAVAVNAQGIVYVADQNNSTIRQILPNGMVSTVAGSAGNPGSTDGSGAEAQFSYPSGIAVDDEGNVFVADRNNSTIRLLSSDGKVSTVAGMAGSEGAVDGATTSALLAFPAGLATGTLGTLYVADPGSQTIRLIQIMVSPKLTVQIKAAEHQLILSWSAFPAGFVLEKSMSVGPGAVWTPVTTAFERLATRFVVVENMDDPTGFYRLHKTIVVPQR